MNVRLAISFLCVFTVAVGLMAAAPPAAAAQEHPAPTDSTAADTTTTDTTRADTVRTDTLRADTTQRPPRRADSTLTDSTLTDSTAAPAGAGRGAPPGEAVTFSARDSLVIVFDEDEGDVGTLYGEAEIKRKDLTLNAYQVDMLLDRSELRATGLSVDTGTVGLPRFQRGEGEAFTGRELAFNLSTERGRVVEARTGYEEGFVEGEVVKTYGDSVQFVRDGQYTTCDCPREETPSYSLRSGKMKVRGKWVYTGPIQLYIFNIPTLLVLPFSFLPNTAGRRSGIIAPTYGDDHERGFYLKDFGYYWAFNDYMDLQLTGGLWSRGSWQGRPLFRYSKRYRYNGSLQLDYTRNIIGDVVDSDYTNETETSIKWNHAQDFNPTMSLRGDVSIATESYLRGISDNYDDNVTQRTSSSINFSKDWAEGARGLDVTLRQSQTFSGNESVNLTLPDLSFSQDRFLPFARDRRGPGEHERWYERVTVRYSGTLNNDYDFQPLPDSTLAKRGATDISWYDALFSAGKHERATGEERRFNFSASHDVPVNASFTLDRYDLNITPSFNYSEDWFINTERKEVRIDSLGFISEAGADPLMGRPRAVVDTSVVSRSEPGFFAAREFNLGVGANTTFYGLFPVHVGPFSGLRHTVRPSLSFNLRPNLYNDFFGRTRTYRDPDTGERVRYDITNGNEVRGSNAQRSLNFSVDNTFETKRVRIDSTGAQETETFQVLRVDASSRYNFAADSLRLGDIDIGFRSPALNRLGVNADADLTFSPYAYENNRLTRRFVISEPGLRLARLTRFNFSLNTSLEGGERDRAAGARGDELAGTDLSGNDSQLPGSFPDDISGRPSYSDATGRYADFSIPWSLNLGFTYNLRNRSDFSTSAILNADFSLNLTPRWKVSGVSGYDFTEGKLSATRLDLLHDFECWQMSFNWTPFGPRQSYGFSLYVKSGPLRNLLNLRLPRSGIKDRFGGLIPRR